MVSGTGYTLQSMAILPQDLVRLILKDVPEAGLARLRLTCQSVRACVDTFTSWPFIYRIHKIFNSIKKEHVTAKPGLSYTINYKTSICATYESGELLAQSAEIPELRLGPIGNVLGNYQVSANLFVCVPSPSRVCQFSIRADGTLEKTPLSKFVEIIKDLSRNRYLPFFSMTEFLQRQNFVQIHLYERDAKYLLTFEIDPLKVNTCYLRELKQLVFSLGNNEVAIEEFATTSSQTQTEAPVSRKTSFTVPPRTILLHSQGRWLLVRCLTNVPLQVHYIFYHAETGKEHLRYSLDRNRGCNEIYDFSALCVGVNVPPSPDNGADFSRGTIFMNDNFCLFFQPPSAKVVRAALIWIEKKRIIPLSLQTQQILCSFDQIKDLRYLSQGVLSDLTIEGEREGKSIQIHLTISTNMRAKRTRD